VECPDNTCSGENVENTHEAEVVDIIEQSEIVAKTKPGRDKESTWNYTFRSI